MNFSILKVIKTVAFFSVGFIILYLVFANQQEAYLKECALKGIAAEDCSLYKKVLQDFRESKIFYLLLSVFLFMISNIIRALRWHLLLKPLGYTPKLYNTLGATMIGYLLNLSIPRAGEIAKPATVTKYEKIPIDVTIGTIVTDRIMDVICLGIVFLLTILLGSRRILDYLSANIHLDQSAIFNPAILFSLLGLGVLGLWIAIKNWQRLKEMKFIGKVVGFVEGIWKGVASVMKMKRVGLFLTYTVSIWVLYYLMTYVVFFAFAPTAHLDMLAGLVVFLFGSLGIMIPSPGGMGSYHFLVGEALALHGISGTDAFSFANLIFFSIQIFGNIIFGGMSLILLPILNKAPRDV